ncbi:unnamed protein product, partial [Prorocentrum cordatum]
PFFGPATSEPPSNLAAPRPPAGLPPAPLGPAATAMPASAPAATSARRAAAAPRRRGGQRHQLGAEGSTRDRLLLQEARDVLADGVCDAPLRQAGPAAQCPAEALTALSWSPASTACTDTSQHVAPLALPAAAADLEGAGWPSVREAGRRQAAERDWDFCSEVSDEEDGSWVEESWTRALSSRQGPRAARPGRRTALPRGS